MLLLFLRFFKEQLEPGEELIAATAHKLCFNLAWGCLAALLVGNTAGLGFSQFEKLVHGALKKEDVGAMLL